MQIKNTEHGILRNRPIPSAPSLYGCRISFKGVRVNLAADATPLEGKMESIAAAGTIISQDFSALKRSPRLGTHGSMQIVGQFLAKHIIEMNQ